MIFAALSDSSKKEAAEIAALVVQDMMSGTPDAARAEPFTWITWLGICSLGLLGLAALLKLLKQHTEAAKEFTNSVRETNNHMAAMQDRCHATQIQTLKMATDAVQVAATSAHDSKGLITEVKEMIRTIMEKLA